MVDLAATIIDPCYANMKERRRRYQEPEHVGGASESSLHNYAAKDAYACYDMYRRILDMRACLLPVTDEYTESRIVMIKHARKV